MSEPARDTSAPSSAPASPPPVAPPASAAVKLPAAEPGAALTAYQKRKAREAEREAAAERRRQARAAKNPPEAKPEAEPAAQAPTDPGVPVRSTELRLRDISVALRVIWRVVGLLVGLLGYQLDPLTEKEAAGDAQAWLPVVERYPAADKWITWVALPAVTVERMAEKLHRKPEAVKA